MDIFDIFIDVWVMLCVARPRIVKIWCKGRMFIVRVRDKSVSNRFSLSSEADTAIHVTLINVFLVCYHRCVLKCCLSEWNITDC